MAAFPPPNWSMLNDRISGSRTLVGSGTTIGERSVWNLVDLIVKMRLKHYGGFLEAALSLPT